MGNETYDAIVIGAGPGGAACAGLLAKGGMKVLLVEKNDRPGGKTMTVSKDGFTYELWPVTANPIHNSQYKALIQELGLEVELLEPIPGPAFYYRAPGGKFAPYEMPGPVPMTEEEAKGKQLVLASIMCPPDPEMKNPQVWWDQLDETIAEIWPDFHEHIEKKETFSIANISAATRDHVLPGQGGECIGLGQIIGQCCRTKPSARAPVRGLFYVGTDAGGYSCGTHQAVDSAFNVARQVLRYHQTH